MNILLVNYEYYPQGGGAGLPTYNMARAFTSAGHNVGVILGWDSAFGELEKDDEIQYYVVPIGI